MDVTLLYFHDCSRVGLTCRRYVTPVGVAGAPTLDQLRTVLTGA